MLYRNSLVVLRAYGDEEGGESGAQNTPITDTPEFKAALQSELQKAIERETSGLKNKLTEVLGEKKKTQEQLNAILSQAEDEQDQAALKAGKLDVQSLLDKKIAARDQSWQQRLAEEQAEKEELRKAIDSERSRLKQFQIKQLIGNEAIRNEFFQPTALEDLLFLAANSWDLSESGDLISRDGHGNVVLGRNGRSLAPAEWIESLKSSRPHYFKQMPGSGGKQGSGGAGKSISRADWQKAIATSTPAEQKELFEKRAKGEIVIQG